MFTKAIVRKPGRSLVNGLTEAGLGQPDFSKALEQHKNYVKALESAGLEVTVLPALEEYPDSCFVEDVAVCTPKGAILTRPGAASRKGEVAHIESTLREAFDTVLTVDEPGSIDGGDVMMVGDIYYIGLSKRTTPAGAGRFIEFLAALGLQGQTVPISSMLHLKTGAAYLENDHLLTVEALQNEPAFARLKRHLVPAEEAYAANTIWVNGAVIMPAGFPRTQTTIEALGYPVVPVELSEFQKLDGGASCLSLRF